MLKVETTLPDWPPGFTAKWAADTLTTWARVYAIWHTQRPLPPLYGGRIVYRLPRSHGTGVEEFANPWVVASRGWGDCDSLTTYRLTELMSAGQYAEGFVPRTRGQWVGNNIHVLVRIAPGGTPETHPERFEDPSLICLAIEALRKKQG